VILLEIPQFIGEILLDVSVTFGIVLRELRHEKKLSQEELSLRAGLQRKYISHLEKADHQPKLETLFKLATALDITPSQLLALVEEKLAMRT